MLKLYVNKKLIDEHIPYVPLLYPFWGTVFNKNTPFPNAAFEKYGFDPTYYQIVENSNEADYVLLPHNYWHLKGKYDHLLDSFIQEARENKKLLLIDARSDIEKEVSVPESVVLKVAQYRFKLRENEIIVPFYVDDLLEHYKEGIFFERIKKDGPPVIGFSGWAHIRNKDLIKTTIKELPIRFYALLKKPYGSMKKGVLWRKQAIDILNNSRKVTPNFIVRSSYSGHLKTIEGDAETIRKEFVENILTSDYALDVRGDANASCRFYEILSLGRIPLYIDTERVLPLEDKIDYSSFCMTIPFAQVNRIDEIVAQFHKNTSPETFITMQKKAREVFETYLRIDRYTKYLAELLEERAYTHYNK